MFEEKQYALLPTCVSYTVSIYLIYLISQMKRYVSHWLSLPIICSSFFYLCLINSLPDDTRREIAEKGGLKQLIALLSTNDSELHKSVARALTNLGLNGMFLFLSSFLFVSFLFYILSPLHRVLCRTNQWTGRIRNNRFIVDEFQ